MFNRNISKIAKTLVSLALALTAFSCSEEDLISLPDSQSLSQDSQANNAISNQFVVKFKDKMSSTSVQSFANQINAQLIKNSPIINTAVFKTLDGMTIDGYIESLKTNPLVDYAEKNFQYTNKYTVSDPRSKEQNGLAIAGLAKAWDITFGDPKVIIAVVDTGIDLTHPDLKNKIVTGYNVITQGKTPPKDDNGHGTHASGIAAADTNNKIGVAGTAPKCRLMPIKALDAKGSGDTFNVALGVVWAADHGARVINMSLGGPNNETLQRAIEYALAKNVVVVAAMGNDGKNKKAYPAALPGVISVGSIDFDKRRSEFSNYGDWITVVAPGSQILSTLPTYEASMTEFEKEQGYDYLDGTSMACPMVAGLAGLILSRNPNYTPEEVKQRIQSTAVDLGKPGYDIEYGHGLINAAKAIL